MATLSSLFYAARNYIIISIRYVKKQLYDNKRKQIV